MSRHGRRSWQPLLAPEESGLTITLAEEIGEEIAGDLRRRLESPELSEPLPMGRASFSLSGGWAGQSLFLAYLEAERGSEGVSWLTREAVISPQLRMGAAVGHYNLGTAHGIPGVIGWLGQVCASGLDIAEARSLLAGAVPWLLRQQNPPGSPSRFPIAVVPGQERKPSSLAWCYGDLGIAAALLTAARGADEPEWEQAALELAHAAALRSKTEEAGSPGICHGAAGNAHLFNRLWQATGDPALAAAARLWLRRLLASRRPGEGLAGFLAFIADAEGEAAWRRDPGFLTGAAGVGLVLLAAATPVEPEWDRLLLAS